MKTVCRFHASLVAASLLFCFTELSWADALPGLQLHISEPAPSNEFTRRPELEWTAQPGVVYWVQSSTNLADAASWVTVEPVESKSFPVRWEGPELDAVTRYYRLQAQPEIFSVEPSFVDSSDTNAVLYILGQLLPTNATVVINGQSFTPTIVNSNGVWATVRLNGLPPGVPVIGTITVIDNGTSNIVATLPVQSPIIYGTELTAEQLQGPPEDPPASPAKKEFKGHVTLMKAFDDEDDDGAAGARHTKTGHVTLLKRGGDNSGAAGARHTKTGHVTLLKRGDNAGGARMADALGGGKKEFKGHVTLLKREMPGGDPDDDDDGDRLDIDATLLMPALMKAKEKANRTKCSSNLRVNPASGELQAAEIDLAIPGRGLDFVWTRIYRSRTGQTTEQGAGWDFSYNVRLDNLTASTVTLHTGDGRSSTFYRDGTNGWFRDEYFLAIGDLDSDGVPDRVTFPDGGEWRFHPPGTAASGKLHQMVDRSSNTITFSYDGAGRLSTIVDDLDRTNTVAYNPAGKIESVTDFSGRAVRYEYNGNGDLVACVSPVVTGTPTGNDFPGGITNRYTYTSGNPDDRLNHNLTGCTDGKGQTWLQIFYGATNNPASIDFDAVARLQRGVDKQDIRRAMLTGRPDNSFATVRVTVRDAVGNVTECFYDSRQRCVRQLDYTGRSNTDLPVTETDNRPTGKLRADDPDYFETKWTWNPDSLCTSEIRPNGDSTEIVHQRAQDHNSSRSNRTSRRHDGDVRVLRERASSAVDTDGDGVADTSELVWRFEYDPRFGSPVGNGVAIKVKGTGADKNRFANGPRQTTSMDGSFSRDNSPIIRGSAVESAKVIMDRDTGRSKGFGFVISATDPRGSVTTSEYDDQGNQSRETTVAFNGGNGVEVRANNARYNARGQLTAITNAADANGLRRVDTFSYHASGPQAGYLASIAIDEQGVHLTTTFEYDSRGNVTRCVDPRTNDWRFTYNALDQCVRSESPTNILSRCTTDSHYDENGNVVRTTTELRDETDTLVNLVNNFCTYDFLDRCTSVAGQVYKGYYITNRFEYDPNGNMVTFFSPRAAGGVDPNARRTFKYDERDLPFRSVAAPGTGLGATNQWDYDRNGNLRVSKVDAFTIKQVAFDGFNRPISVTDAMSNVVIYAYNRNDNLVFARVNAETNDTPTSAGNLRYHEWRWRYDGFDRCIEASSLFFDPVTQTPIGDGLATTRIAFAPIGQCSSVTDDNGHTTSYGYDTAGRLSSITGPNAKTAFAILRDRCDNVTSCTQNDRSDIPGPVQTFVQSFAYDSLNRCVADWNNVGNTNLYNYDSLDRVVRSIDPRGVVSWAVYDDLDRLAHSVTDLDGNGVPDLAVDVDTFWAYDENSQCVTTTDDNTNSTFYTYDSLDRCATVTEADGTICSLVWSPRSNLIFQHDANNTVVSNSFDLLDRCVRIDITPGLGVATTTTFETFAYDGLSRLVAATNDASHSEFAYDSMGNCVRGTSGGFGSLCTFDGVGNRLSLTYPSGRLVTYTYDALDQIASLSSSAGGLPLVTLVNYAYEGLGRVGRIGRTNNVNTRITWNGLVNPANTPGDFGWQQVNGINHQITGGGAIIDRRASSFDRNQNKTSRAQLSPFFLNGPTTTNLFTYDALDRLTQFTRASGSPSDLFRAYSLDGNGNRRLGISNGVAAPYVMDNTFPNPADFQVNQYTLTPFVLAPEQYDQNGNLIGRIASTAQFAYQYDYADRLVQVLDFSSGVPAPLASYSYDALGRRISKTVYSSGLPPVTTQYFYGGDDDCDGVLEISNGGNPVAYCYGAKTGKSGSFKRFGIGDTAPECPLGRFTGAGELQFYHCDDLGNVLALTGASGNVIERYDYDDFGSPQFLTSDGFQIATNASPAGSPFLFRGMEWDVETGLYHGDSGSAAFASYKATQGKSGKAKNALRYADPYTGRGITRGDDDTGNPWSQRDMGNINGGMPNRISMNVTVPKQTQGATFGEKVNAGLHAAGSALAQGRSVGLGEGGGGAGGSKAQDHNSSRSNKTASGIDLGGGGGGGGGFAIESRNILKSFFQTGDKPTQSQLKVLQYSAKAGKTGKASGK